MVEIFVQPDRVWGFCNDRVDCMVLARDENFGVEISLERVVNHYEISVMCDDDIVANSVVDSEAKCGSVADEYYERFLSGDPTKFFDYEEPDADELDEKIREHEHELFAAALDFVETLVPNIEDFTNDVGTLCSEVIDIVCEYFYKVHDCSVYRPGFHEKDGYLLYTEYPYDEEE